MKLQSEQACGQCGDVVTEVRNIPTETSSTVFLGLDWVCVDCFTEVEW